MPEVATGRTVVLRPNAIYRLGAVWFETAQSDGLPRSLRLGGFDLQQPRPAVVPVISRHGHREEYLAVRNSIVRRHGGVPEVAFESTAAVYGVFAPHLLCLDAWPDEPSLRRFETDPTFRELRARLDIADTASAVGWLEDAFRSAREAFVMSFDAESTYELCAFWRSVTWTPERQRSFFESVIPSRTRHQAGAGFVVVPAHGDYLPDLLSISQWPSLDSFAAFVEDPEHEEVSRRRLAAFSRMDATALRLCGLAEDAPGNHATER